MFVGRIIDLSVEYISLVKRPATGKGLILKNADGKTARLFEISKTDDERQVAYGIVYPVEEFDKQDDIASEDVVRKAAYTFMAKARHHNIDFEHSFDSEAAYVAESWLVRKGDALFDGEPIGSWAVGIQVGDPLLWKRIKAGEVTGLSLAGLAREEAESVTTYFTGKDGDGVPGWFAKFIKGLMPAQKTLQNGDTEMNEDQVRTLVGEEIAKGVGPAVVAALKAAGLPAEPEKAPEKVAQADPEKITSELIEAAVAKALAATGPIALQIETAVAKAVAKGASESEAATTEANDSFA